MFFLCQLLWWLQPVTEMPLLKLFITKWKLVTLSVLLCASMFMFSIQANTDINKQINWINNGSATECYIQWYLSTATLSKTKKYRTKPNSVFCRQLSCTNIYIKNLVGMSFIDSETVRAIALKLMSYVCHIAEMVWDIIRKSDVDFTTLKKPKIIETILFRLILTSSFFLKKNSNFEWKRKNIIR